MSPTWRSKRDDDAAVNRAEDNEPGAGTRAKERALSSLSEARRLWPEVNEVAESLRELRRHNGFTERITAAVSGVREK